MPTPIFYYTPQNPTGFIVYNPQFTKGTIMYLHGKGGIGPGTSDPWGLAGFISMGELPPDLINYAEQEEMVLIAPRCDSSNGWTHQMVNNVLAHTAVSGYPKETFHIIGYSLGGGEVGNYLLASQENSAKFATAFVCYMVSANGTFANIVNAKTLVVGITAVKDSTVSPSYTTGFVDAVNNAGANPRAIKKVFDSGDHGGKLPEVFRNTPYPEFENMGMYDFMKAKSRTGTQPPTQPPPKVEDFRFTRAGKQIIGYTDKTWAETVIK